jgi:hypothetical protein
MGTLSQFAAQLRDKNVSKPSLYYVEIVPPPLMLPPYAISNSTDTNLISLWCAAAQTPQSTILTRDEYLEAGTRRKYAYDQDYANLTLTFYLDQKYEIKKFFDLWKQSIVPQRRNFEYPDSYTAEKLNLYIINQEEKKTYSYEYSRIFPKSINPVDLSYGNSTSIATLTVDFVFEEVYFSTFNESEVMSMTSKPNVKIDTSPQSSLNKEAYQEQESDDVGMSA